ncbi:hypothetical protein Ahy_A04g017241 [Arachis hypogaea]|uniref:Uncharacterized protein n=1 Tax=Arachis hypogaea TaxID=3818 RepID=A0A445DAH5_ARAHY|nr:hypothetical protein Ahy_A04g017241 [Arachis hypogaea]
MKTLECEDKNVPGYTATALAKMRGTASISLASTIDPPKSTNTKATSQINLPCHGGYNNYRIPSVLTANLNIYQQNESYREYATMLMYNKVPP